MSPSSADPYHADKSDHLAVPRPPGSVVPAVAVASQGVVDPRQRQRTWQASQDFLANHVPNPLRWWSWDNSKVACLPGFAHFLQQVPVADQTKIQTLVAGGVKGNKNP